MIKGSARLRLARRRLLAIELELPGIMRILDDARTPGVDTRWIAQAIGGLKSADASVRAATNLIERELLAAIIRGGGAQKGNIQ